MTVLVRDIVSYFDKVIDSLKSMLPMNSRINCTQPVI